MKHGYRVLIHQDAHDMAARYLRTLRDGGAMGGHLRRVLRDTRLEPLSVEDFLEQLQKVKQMGPLSQLLDMIPGLGAQMRQAKAQISDDDYKRVEAIIYSMTADERRNPDIIGKRRAARIARGSGTTPQEVRALIKQFEEMKKMMSQFGRMARKGKMPPGLPFG